MPSVRKPGFTDSTRNRLRPRSAAPTSSTTVIAICAATIDATDALTGRASLRTPAVGRASREDPRAVARMAVTSPSAIATRDDSAHGEAEDRPAQRNLFQPRQIGGRE